MIDLVTVLFLCVVLGVLLFPVATKIARKLRDDDTRYDLLPETPCKWEQTIRGDTFMTNTTYKGTAKLQFDNEQRAITGSGTDRWGKFALVGRFTITNEDEAKIYMLKTYVVSNETYKLRGVFKSRAIEGRWASMTSSDVGSFELYNTKNECKITESEEEPDAIHPD